MRYLFTLLLFSLIHLCGAEEFTPKRSICLVINQEFRGEREFAERIRIASERLQWKVQIVDIDNFQEERWDWIFTMIPNKRSSRVNEDYLMLFDPEHHYFNRDGHLQRKYRNYTGFLATFGNLKVRRLYPLPWYPTVQYRPYKKVTPTRLFYFIGHWGDRHNNPRYIAIQQQLAQTTYAHLFGNPAKGSAFGTAFKGDLTYDGESVINTISDMGVCLVLHSKTHLKHKIPSGRIFEAAAASAVIISDLNRFVLKHFGDTVLYIDQELSGQEIFNQIDAHMDWIGNHPEEALEKARKAHEIFEEQFLLEKQLLDFDSYRPLFKN